jgi:hypothetical protein
MSANDQYVNDAYGRLVGRTIIGVRALHDGEMQMLAWSTRPSAPVGVLLVLDDDSIVLPMSDAEGNEPGFLLVQ